MMLESFKKTSSVVVALAVLSAAMAWGVFMAVVALHIAVVGGFTIWRLMSF